MYIVHTLLCLSWICISVSDFHLNGEKREKNLVELTQLIESKNFNLFTPFGDVALPLWATLFGYRPVDGPTTWNEVNINETRRKLFQLDANRVSVIYRFGILFDKVFLLIFFISLNYNNHGNRSYWIVLSLCHVNSIRSEME